MSGRDAEIAIVGAGAAGLSLAWQLVERGLHGRRVILLEPRTRYERDRTFCFWNDQPHPFVELASHRWPRWRVRGEGEWIVRSAPGLAYHHLPADAFYERVLARLEETPGVELRLGVRVEALQESVGGVVVDTDSRDLRAGAVFDSRPIRGPVSPDDVTLLQHFEGWQIRCDHDVFDPTMATLMDFAVSQEHGIHFVYVLPYGPREALVEATWFAAETVDDDTYRRFLERYLRAELRLEAWEIVHRERGVIPMTTAAAPVRVGRRVYRIGLAGGMAKPSTGYAFQSIQRFSREMAARLDREELPEPPAPRGWRARTLDRIFLSYLERYPSRGPSIFADLFGRVEPELLIRFLGDRASAADCLRVMRALPFAPLTAETLRAAPIWLRRG